MEWRDKLALRSRRQADYAWVVLARVLSWSLNRGLVAANPCERGGRLYRGSRADKVWTLEDEIVFLERAPPHLHLPLTLALWTGQRQGDLLRLAGSAWDLTPTPKSPHGWIRLRQSKTGVGVNIPVGSPLKVALDTTPRQTAFEARGGKLVALHVYRHPALAEEAIRKLESRTKTPDRAPDCA